MSGIEQRAGPCCKNSALSGVPGAPAAHIVVIALSAGGLIPLRAVLSRLPWDLPAAVIALQHLSGLSYLPTILRRDTHLNVKFAQPGDLPQCGNVYVGPPGRHLVIGPDTRLVVIDAPRVRFARPSADWLFYSAAGVFGDRIVAVVLSGRLSDGARGVAQIGRAGGHVIAQDPSSCRFPDMPLAAIQTGAVHAVLRPNDVAQAIVDFFHTRDIARETREWSEPFAAD